MPDSCALIDVLQRPDGTLASKQKADNQMSGAMLWTMQYKVIGHKKIAMR